MAWARLCSTARAVFSKVCWLSVKGRMAFGATLSDLTAAFKQADTDVMLTLASALIEDFVGGTRLGASLATLRKQHARRLLGRRTIVLIITHGLDTGKPAELAQELG